MLSEKGKYATATANRRFVWNHIIWPLILDTKASTFVLRQYQKKRSQVCHEKNIPVKMTSRGLVSLQQKDILKKEHKIYSIHYRLIPYMRLNAYCDYGTAIYEAKIK